MTNFRLPLSGLRWRTRATLWLAALCAGLAVVAFAKLAELALGLFSIVIAAFPWLPFPLTPAIGMITVWLTMRYFPGAQGSGIPQVIVATRLAAAGSPVGHLVSLRIAFGKICLGTFALLGGFSAGREGPSVQVAGSILHAAHRFLPHSRALRAQDLLLAGGAAGVAAAFNTPLAGIVFAVEELGRKLETRTSGILISTIIISGLVAIALLGNYNYFGHITVTALDRSSFFPVIAGGVICGLLGVLQLAIALATAAEPIPTLALAQKTPSRICWSMWPSRCRHWMVKRQPVLWQRVRSYGKSRLWRDSASLVCRNLPVRCYRHQLLLWHSWRPLCPVVGNRRGPGFDYCPIPGRRFRCHPDCRSLHDRFSRGSHSVTNHLSNNRNGDG